MELSPQDVGRLLRFAPFAIAVLVALWTRFRTARARPAKPTSFPTYPTAAGRPSSAAPPSAAATASSRPIEPR